MSVSVGQAVLLGTVQGLTEFLPVSSTAHLALAQRFLPGFAQPGILFDVVLHVGTLAAVAAVLSRPSRAHVRRPRLVRRRRAARRMAARGLPRSRGRAHGRRHDAAEGPRGGGMGVPAQWAPRSRDGRPPLRRPTRGAREAKAAARSKKCARGTPRSSARASRFRRSSTASRARGTRSPSACLGALAPGGGRVLVPPLDPDDPRGRRRREPAR